MNPQAAQRILVKLGTKVVVDPEGGLNRERISQLMKGLLAHVGSDRDILIVSSGAVELGRVAMGLSREGLSLTQRQACAAVGQASLIQFYQSLFAQWNRKAAQILVTAEDLSRRSTYLHVREAMETLISWKVIPVINENDSTSIAELKSSAGQPSFGDNDRLSALVAGKTDADLLILLTDVDGVYSENPKLNPQAHLYHLIEDLADLQKIITQGKSDAGRGGMKSKIEAARIASVSGVWTLIASGMNENVLEQFFSCSDVNDSNRPGSLIKPVTSIPQRQRWIGYSGSQGALTINDGAKRALLERQASLLPSGIVAVSGAFASGQVVSLVDEVGVEVGRGVVYFSSAEVEALMGRQSHDIARMLGPGRPDVIIQRDNLVIFSEHEA